MFVHRLTDPIDFFDDLTPLPDWLRSASNEETRWLLQAVFALADTESDVCWRGEMRHLPSIGFAESTPYLVVKQDDNGSTFVVTASETLSLTTTVSVRVPTRRIGGWTHPTVDDILALDTERLASSVRHLDGGEPPF